MLAARVVGDGPLGGAGPFSLLMPPDPFHSGVCLADCARLEVTFVVGDTASGTAVDADRKGVRVEGHGSAGAVELVQRRLGEQ